MELGNDNSPMILKTKTNFKNVLKKLDNLKNINDDIISILNKGIKNKIVLPKLACKLLINQFKEFKKNKSFQYLNIKKLKAINFEDFNNNLEKLLLPELNKIIEYLSNIYLPKCRNTIGLCDLPKGKNLYKLCIEEQVTIKNFNIDKIHNYGLEEIKRINKSIEDIKKSINLMVLTKSLKNI